MRSIREAYNVCSSVGGIKIKVPCSHQPKMRICRSGYDGDEYTLDVSAAIVSGDVYTFPIPKTLLSMPVGYYDAIVHDGVLHKKTIRLNLNTSGSASSTQLVDALCDDGMPEPNVDIVTECDPCADECPTACEVEIRKAEAKYCNSPCGQVTILRGAYKEPAKPCFIPPVYKTFKPVKCEKSSNQKARAHQYKMRSLLSGGLPVYDFNLAEPEQYNVANYINSIIDGEILDVYN